MSIYADGKVEGGQLILYDRQRFIDRIKQFEGKGVRLSLTQGNQRSKAQNRYLWGVVYHILAEAFIESGEFANEELVHDLCKIKFLPKLRLVAVNKKTGEIEEHSLPNSTRKLSTVQFMEYVEKIQMWASEFMGVVIPDPNQTEWLDESIDVNVAA